MRYNSFTDLDSAAAACTVDPDCIAVAHTSCDGTDFQLCGTWFGQLIIFADSRRDSCVYPKSPEVQTVNIADQQRKGKKGNRPMFEE